MSGMVERVARALYARRWREVKGQAEQKPEQQFESSVYREHYLAGARAAIEAMREPTVVMLIAALGPWTSEHGDLLTANYRDMIDEALKEPSRCVAVNLVSLTMRHETSASGRQRQMVLQQA
jgi:hypothetical protein